MTARRGASAAVQCEVLPIAQAFQGKSHTTLSLPRGVSAEEVEQECCNNRPDA